MHVLALDKAETARACRSSSVGLSEKQLPYLMACLFTRLEPAVWFQMKVVCVLENRPLGLCSVLGPECPVRAGPCAGRRHVSARAAYGRPSGTPAGSVHVGESGVRGTVWSLSWVGKGRQVSRRCPAGAGHFESWVPAQPSSSPQQETPVPAVLHSSRGAGGGFPHGRLDL